MIPAFRGEFGLKVRYHVPWVAALPRPVTVEIEEGEEALYPDAAHVIVPRDRPDADRHGTRGLPDPKAPTRRFVPEPVERYGIEADVVICPRKREYGSAKNWGYWPKLAEWLTKAGHRVFAAGAPDSSYDCGCPSAWEHPRFLDASIEAMLSARMVVATDAGLAHLAVLCGRPLMVITDDGRVAPGPVIDSSGRVAHREYWPVRWQEYYHAANHTGSPILETGDWLFPKLVRDRILEEL